MRMLATLMFVLLTGCAASILERNVGQVDGPPAFKTGYTHGCSSGLRAGGFGQLDFVKDVLRYNNEPLYAQGWEDGYRVCRTRALS